MADEVKSESASTPSVSPATSSQSSSSKGAQSQDAGQSAAGPERSLSVREPVELNHGEPDPTILREQEAQQEALKDPWGTTPTQMRDVHDPFVDPQTDDAAPVAGSVPNGIEPARSNDGRPDEAKVQGTLPPV